jgi:UDP-N-acetylglucosamine 2-epimerase
MIDNYVERHPKRCLAVTSLGMPRYLSAMKYCSAVIGNSSSGIVEAPSFKVPTINIGDRQKGRVMAESVTNCSRTKDAIIQALKKALSPEFRQNMQEMTNPYERENTATNIKKIIKNFDLRNILKKEFYDI